MRTRTAVVATLRRQMRIGATRAAVAWQELSILPIRSTQSAFASRDDALKKRNFPFATFSPRFWFQEIVEELDNATKPRVGERVDRSTVCLASGMLSLFANNTRSARQIDACHPVRICKARLAAPRLTAAL